MATEIYLEKSGSHSSSARGENFFKWVLTTLFDLGDRLLPGTAETLERSQPRSPTSTARAVRFPDDYQRDKLVTVHGELVLHSFGKGPVVLFSHGWSGDALQFKPLMEQVVNAGYRAVALDHYCHGESGGADSNLLLFVRALQLVNQHLVKTESPVHAVVGHSVGGISSLHVFDSHAIPQLLISPIIGMNHRICNCALGAGVSEKNFKVTLAAIAEDYGQCFKRLDEQKVLRDPRARVHLLHSRVDRLVPVGNTMNFHTEAPHLGLTITDSGGHIDILNHASTSAIMLWWLAHAQSSA